MSPWRKRLIWLLVPVLLVVVDQWTKALVRETIDQYDRIEVIEGFFRINHVQNKGAAFGLFSDLADGERELLLSTLGGIALMLVVFYSLRLPPHEWLSQLGLHMIFAGAIGNLVDRFTIGWVTDFLEFYWQQFRWPAFNVADSCIVLGVCLLLIDTFRPHRKRQADRAAEGAEEAGLSVSADKEIFEEREGSDVS
ncbi:MAG TPA: signal peptidase II [Acidobacteriota bacterium]|nr:signal peptidase II [Acidobacteriota bacterium]